MTGIRRAQAALDAAKAEARRIVTEAQLELGREILAARATGEVEQKDVAEELAITREQVRRLEVAAEKSGTVLLDRKPGRHPRRTGSKPSDS
ncbi:hypothetical protein [Acrocarpospora sp. B8E8]|uniref:hypothetical protein n=1 Tax=Acrocarpospora sp. B8E8 TaxID=3153572 RepID=UPI00325EEC40